MRKPDGQHTTRCHWRSLPVTTPACLHSLPLNAAAVHFPVSLPMLPEETMRCYDGPHDHDPSTRRCRRAGGTRFAVPIPHHRLCSRLNTSPAAAALCSGDLMHGGFTQAAVATGLPSFAPLSDLLTFCIFDTTLLVFLNYPCVRSGVGFPEKYAFLNHCTA